MGRGKLFNLRKNRINMSTEYVFPVFLFFDVRACFGGGFGILRLQKEVLSVGYKKNRDRSGQTREPRGGRSNQNGLIAV